MPGRPQSRRAGWAECVGRSAGAGQGAGDPVGNFPMTGAAEKRVTLRAGLNSGRLQRLPGAFSPLVARVIAAIGFEGVYVSGAAVSADLGLPDIGLTTLTEVAARGTQIASVTDLPTLIDADTGFGAPLNAARTVTC